MDGQTVDLDGLDRLDGTYVLAGAAADALRCVHDRMS